MWKNVQYEKGTEFCYFPFEMEVGEKVKEMVTLERSQRKKEEAEIREVHAQ